MLPKTGWTGARRMRHYPFRSGTVCGPRQWRWCRTKVRNLLALGTSKRQAILTAISSKSYWHLPRILATQTGMTNEWLRTQGLVNIRALWRKAHGYAKRFTGASLL